MSALVPGATFGSYVVEEIAGAGGMGAVYRARQPALDRPVALKVIASQSLADADFRERFQREARMAAAIDHPNIVPVYEAGELEGRLFLVMRFVRGSDLAKTIKDKGPLAPGRAVEIIGDVASALDAAHAHGLVHRDVKPSNVLIADNGHVYLTDFGLSKLETDGSMTQTGQVIGTPDYISPEQVRGEPATPLSDVYALGCVLFDALAGRSPFKQSSVTATLLAHLNEPVPPLPDGVPAALNSVVDRALAKNPADRFASAGELAKAARDALSGTPAAAPPARASAAADKDPTRRRRLAVAFVLPALLAIGVIAALLAATGVIGGDDDEPEATRPPAATAPATTTAAAPPPPAADVQPRVAQTIDVGGQPDGITTSEDTVFVADSKGRLIAINPKTGKLRGQPVPAGKDTDSVAGGKGVVWSTATDDDKVMRFEAKPDPVRIATIDVGDKPEGISLGRQLVWVVNAGEDTVQFIDRATATNVGVPVGTGKQPIDVFVGSSSAWIVNGGDDTVTKMDVSSREVIGAPIRVGREPRGVAEGEGGVWVTNSADGTVTRINPKTGRVVATIRVGGQPGKVATGGGFVWVTDAKTNTLIRIDPARNRVAGSPVAVGARPIGVAVGFGAVWVASADDGTVTKVALR